MSYAYLFKYIIIGDTGNIVCSICSIHLINLQEKNFKHLPWLDAEDLSFAFLVQNGLGCQFQLTWKLSIFVLKIEFSIFLHISHKYTTKEALLFHTNRKYKMLVWKNTL